MRLEDLCNLGARQSVKLTPAADTICHVYDASMVLWLLTAVSGAAADLYATIVHGSQLSAHTLPAYAFLLVHIQHHHLQAFCSHGS